MDTSAAARTSSQLLDVLRAETGDDALELAGAPVPLTGGYWAELLRFRLANPPAGSGLDGDLVARIVPDAVAGAWESTIQREVARQGFRTPSVRLVAPDTCALGRYLVVMDLVAGRPPLDGLGATTVVRQLPALLRTLPDQLAQVAASLHALDPAPLVAELDALGSTIAATTVGFIEGLQVHALVAERPDLAAAAERLVADEPVSTTSAITHGDLHPFNLLVTPDGPALVDWTVARVAHPAFTVGFTHLTLAHPPVAVPGALEWPLRQVGRRLSGRFLSTYRRLTDGTDAAVDDRQLDWHRRVHALRILVELASWDAAGTRAESGHPWLVLEPVAEQLLEVPARCAGPGPRRI